VAIVHHDQCGAGFLADDAFRRSFSERSGIDGSELKRLAVVDPVITVADDVATLRACKGLSPRVTVSGHVYDLATGLVRTIVAAVETT
jgi:carbonic anhydrase